MQQQFINDSLKCASTLCTNIPLGASTGNADSMRVLAAESRVHLVTGPQCRWKLKDQTSAV